MTHSDKTQYQKTQKNERCKTSSEMYRKDQRQSAGISYRYSSLWVVVVAEPNGNIEVINLKLLHQVICMEHNQPTRFNISMIPIPIFKD